MVQISTKVASSLMYGCLKIQKIAFGRLHTLEHANSSTDRMHTYMPETITRPHVQTRTLPHQKIFIKLNSILVWIISI